jgi:WD40 repeat protein
MYPSNLAFTPSGDHLILIAGNQAQAIDTQNWQPGATLAYQPKRQTSWLGAAGRYVTLEKTSPDSGGSDNGQMVVVYDLPEWKEISRWRCPFDAKTLRVDVDANRAIVLTGSRELKVLDLGTGAELFSSAGKSPYPAEFALSPKARLLAFKSEQSIILVDLASNRELARISSGRSVERLAFSQPDGRYLAHDDGLRSVAVIDTATGKELWRTSSQTTTALLFSPAGNNLVLGSQENVRILRTADGHELRRIDQKLVSQLAFSSTGTYLGMRFYSGLVRVFHVDSGQETFRSGAAAEMIAFSPDERQMASTMRDGSVRVFDIPGSYAPPIRTPPDSEFPHVVFTPDAHFVVIGSADTRVWVVDTSTGKFMSVTGHRSSITAIAVSQDGKRVAVGNVRGPLRVLSLPDMSFVRGFPVGQSLHLAFTPDGDGLFVLSLDPGITFGPVPTRFPAGLFRISNASQTPEQLVDAGELVENAVWSPDRRLVFIETAKHERRVREGLNGRLLLTLPRLQSDHPVFSPKGEYFAIGSSELRVYRPREQRLLWTEAMTSFVDALAFSHDEASLAIARADGTVEVVDSATRQVNCREQLGSGVKAVAFTADDRILLSVTAGHEAVLRRTYIRSPDLIQEACAKVTRNLRPDEWKRFFVAEQYRKTCPDLPLPISANDR